MARAFVDLGYSEVGRRRVSDDQLRSIVMSGAITKVSSATPLDTLRSWVEAIRRTASGYPDAD